MRATQKAVQYYVDPIYYQIKIYLFGLKKKPYTNPQINGSEFMHRNVARLQS